MSCSDLRDDQLVSHILIMDVPREFAFDFDFALGDISDKKKRPEDVLLPLVFHLPIPDKENKYMKGAANWVLHVWEVINFDKILTLTFLWFVLIMTHENL